MKPLHDVLIVTHIVLGFIGLVAFWVPVVARKGGRLHVRAGRVFLYSAYVVAGSAIALSAMTLVDPFATHPGDRPADPAAVPGAARRLREVFVFLGYLGILTLATVHHGVRAIQHGRRRERLATPFHAAVNVAAILAGAAVGALGIARGQIVFVALAPIGFLVGIPALRYPRRPAKERMGHWYEHLGAMIGGGIAFHTAFAVFGIQRFVDYSLDGVAALFPWVAPAIVGTIGIAIWQRRYRKRFGDLPGDGSATAG